MPRLWDTSKVVLWWGPALCLLQPMYHLCFMKVSRDIEVKWVVQDWKWNLWNLMLFLLLLFSYWDMSDSLWPSELQHARLPCPLLSPGACWHSYSLSWWCHPTISSSVASFFSCPQSFPASESFPMSLFFASGGQSAGASVSASVLPMNNQGWCPLGRTGLICPSDSQESSPVPQFESIDLGLYELLIQFGN